MQLLKRARMLRELWWTLHAALASVIKWPFPVTWFRFRTLPFPVAHLTPQRKEVPACPRQTPRIAWPVRTRIRTESVVRALDDMNAHV